MSGRQEKVRRRAKKRSANTGQKGLVRHAPMSGTPSYLKVKQTAEGHVSFEVDLGKIPLPSSAFSADSALVFGVTDAHCTNVLFVGASPSGTAVRSVVKVRFPDTALKQQIERDAVFRERIESYCNQQGMGNPWVPAINEVDDVPGSNVASMEGTFMTMAHWGEAALCDVFQVPPDFAARTNSGVPWDIEGALRITMPTSVLRYMLQNLAQQFEEGLP